MSPKQIPRHEIFITKSSLGLCTEENIAEGKVNFQVSRENVIQI